MSYEDQCRLLEWLTVSDRKVFFVFVRVFLKIVVGFYDLKFDYLFELTSAPCLQTARLNNEYT